MSVIDEIAAERQRQIDQDGWNAFHDAHHPKGELAAAGAAYALHAARFHDAENLGEHYAIKTPSPIWPWERQWWKPKSFRRDLVRAAALIVAEIERLDREAT